MVKILCIRCGQEILLDTKACPHCNFVGPLTGKHLPPMSMMSEADAAKFADGLLLAPGWDANGSPVEA